MNKHQTHPLNLEYDYLVKILIIGDSGVGKSSIMLRYSDDQYIDQSIPTIGVDFKIRTINLDDKIYKLQIWDTAGQERFRTITSSYYRGAQGIIIVYDISNVDTFKNVKMWITECERYAATNVKIIIVGNKSDISENNRQVQYSTGLDFANCYGYKFLETSAKTGNTIDKTFRVIIDEIIQKHDLKSDKKKVNINGAPISQNKKCC